MTLWLVIVPGIAVVLLLLINAGLSFHEARTPRQRILSWVRVNAALIALVWTLVLTNAAHVLLGWTI